MKKRKHYSEEIRRRAKIMWLSGNYSSDKEIARELGMRVDDLFELGEGSEVSR